MGDFCGDEFGVKHQKCGCASVVERKWRHPLHCTSIVGWSLRPLLNFTAVRRKQNGTYTGHFSNKKHVNKQMRKRVLNQQEIHRQFLNNLRLLTSERATPSQAAELMCQEMGKPMAQGKAEVLKCAYLVSRWCLVYILYLLRYKEIYHDKFVGDKNSGWSQGFQEQLTYVIVMNRNESNSDFQPIE